MTSRAELTNRQKALLATPSGAEPEAVTQISGALNGDLIEESIQISRLDTSLLTTVTFFPISFTVSSGSACLRPAINTNAPATNRFAVVSPIPLLPPVMTAISVAPMACF